ncbi:MAG: hypothetical protein RR957_06420, partial [Oscillospiraceae bacterium]
IILAAESVSKDMLQIELAEQKVTGTVGRINQSEKPLTIQLNESEYKVVGNILSKPAVMLGKTVTAYLDMYGNVVYLETGIQQEAQWNYGYVVKSSLNNDGYSLKIFDQSGDMVIRESQDSIIIDGVKTKYKNMPPIEKQLIRYRTDGETLKGIDTFCDRPTGDLQADPTEISDSFYRRGQGRYFYKKNLRIFRTISSGTVKGEILHSIAPVVFNIPEDALDEKDYSVGTIEQFGGDKYYTLEGYNCDAESPLCDVIVIQDSRTGDYEGANMMLVKQAGSLLKADGTVGASLTCIYNGGEYTFAVKEDSSLLIDETYKITAGDVIVATKDGNDELIDIKLVYTESSDYGEINESKTYLGPSGDIGFNSPNRIDYCYLTKRLPDGYFILQNTDNKNLPLIYANNGCSVGVYDRDERRGDNKIRPGNFEDIYGMHVDGNERLLVQTSNSALKSIVILR